MAIKGKLDLKAPRQYQAVLGQSPALWKPGVISLVDESRVPLGAVVRAKNFMQTQDGIWHTRWGSRNYGTVLPGGYNASQITGLLAYTKRVSGVVTKYYIIMINGYLYNAKDGGAWTKLSNTQFSTTARCRMLQWNNKILIANGIDAFSYYDLASNSLVQFTALTTPTGLASSLANLSSGSHPLYYQVTALSANGETAPTTALQVNVNLARENWYPPNANSLGTTSPAVTLTWNKVTNAIGYNIYLSDGVSGIAYWLSGVGQPSSGTTVSYTDYGVDAVNDFIEVPQADTTAAPAFKWLAISNNRIWALDPSGRAYWSGTGSNSLAFNVYLGGGWVDILPGSLEVPTTIAEFRDGKGDPMTTILLADPGGYGSTYHVDLQSDQIGNTTVIVPALMKAVGTFGTLSPFGVVETNQNLYFHSGIGGFFSNGSVPTLFNILATNEISILVRPDIKLLQLAAIDGVCGVEYDRKIFWSVPYGSSKNNRIMVYDLEKLNWNPYAFDFGVSAFTRYTDNTLVNHLIAVPMSGNYLIELNENFHNDNGVAFEAVLQTGVHHVSPDHKQFAQIFYAFFEIGRPQGRITMTLSGTPYNEDFQTLETINDDLGSSGSGVGFSTFGFSTTPFSFTAKAPQTTSRLFQPEQMRVFKLLNNWQAEVYSYDANATYAVNQVVVEGPYVPITSPNSWIRN